MNIKIDPPHRLAAVGTRVTFIGLEGETYVGQASSDLVRWTTIGTAQANTDGEVDMALDNPGADWQLLRFYRAVSP